MNPSIAVFGETLWDILPDRKLAGGAPMNVAVNLRRLGIDVSFISSVGSDELGEELLDFMSQNNLSLTLIQKLHGDRTGVAKANIADNESVTYDLLQPVAYDHIEFNKQALENVRESDYFVYGTLAARNETSRETLIEYLKIAKAPVFDINLRAPHYTTETVKELLDFAKVVKMNDQELREVIEWDAPFQGERKAMETVLKQYSPEIVLLTLGKDGAMVLDKNGQYAQHQGFKVKVADTIGSGDAFLAAFLRKLITNSGLENALAFACAAGALTATKPGALPAFTEKNLEEFVNTAG